MMCPCGHRLRFKEVSSCVAKCGGALQATKLLFERTVGVIHMYIHYVYNENLCIINSFSKLQREHEASDMFLKILY